MIYSNSTLDGFPVVLGSMSVQFAMFATMFLSVKVPMHTEGDVIDSDARSTYYFLLAYHFAIFVVKLVQNRIAYGYYVLYVYVPLTLFSY